MADRGKFVRYEGHRGNKIPGVDTPQVDTPITGGNPTVDSDRVKAPVVGAGSTNFGGSQMHYTVNERRAVEKGGKTKLEVVYEMNTVPQVGI